MALKGTNIKLEIQKTLATAITATGITNANPPVLTHGGADPSNGDVVVITATGIAELDGQAVRVANSGVGTFELEGLDSTNFGTFLTASFQVVSAWETVSKSTAINAGDAASTELDATTLIDTTRQTEFGLPGSAAGSVPVLYDPANAGMVEVKEATLNDEQRVLRITFAAGQITVFNSWISGGQGFDIPANALVTSQFSFAQIKQNVYYAT